MPVPGFLRKLKMKLNEEIKERIEEFAKSKISSLIPVSGGCINNAFKIILNNKKSLFLKFNFNSSNDMFIKEAHGLAELRKAAAIRIPEVLLFDSFFLLIEFIESGEKLKNFYEDFGRKFAQLHKFTQSEFGFYEDNFIGSNPQKNIAGDSEKTDWTKFFFNKRILFQYKLAEKNGYASSELKKGIFALENKIEKILEGSSEPPSLLHGDLWGGNYLIDENGEPCLIDPAVYYGHREADLAMTKLFGGFNDNFYKSYNEIYPLSEGYSYRENIYKLYHILNHLNLFGSGYYSHAISLIKSYM